VDLFVGYGAMFDAAGNNDQFPFFQQDFSLQIVLSSLKSIRNLPFTPETIRLRSRDDAT